MKKAITVIYALLFAMLLMAHSAQADYINSIGMAFKNIPAGSFYMGSCRLSHAENKTNKKRKFLNLSGEDIACPADGVNDDNAKDDEMPRHKVHISKGFQIGVYEVTVEQFKQFIRAEARNDLLTDNFISYNRYGNNVAVTVVSWHDAQAFIRWLNKKEGAAYRLPTEAEWEYATRAETNSIYSWGDSAQADDYAWSVKNAGGNAHAVGGKQASPWGLYDMQGNVWEWVQDGYSKDYYHNSVAKDPFNNRSNRARVFRGGSWKNPVWYLRSGDRGYGRPSLRGSNLGFRLVRQL